MGGHFRKNSNLTVKLFDTLISPILYGSEIWGIDCNGKTSKDPAEIEQNKFLKWLLGVNKYCNNNAFGAERGKVPNAVCRNFQFWLNVWSKKKKINYRKLKHAII